MSAARKRKRARSAPSASSRAPQILTVVGVAIGGFLLYSLTKKASAATMPAGASASSGGASSAPLLSPVSLPDGIYEAAGAGDGSLYQSSLPAPTVAQVAQQSGIWANLNPTSPPGEAGYVNFPSGSQAAVALLPWRTDGVNFFTSWAGVTYAVPVETDAYGNYTANAA